MKRWLGAIIIGLVVVPQAWAQKYAGDVVLSLQGGVGVAVGTFSYDYTYAPEGLAQVDFALADGAALGLRGGYRKFKTENNVTAEKMKISNFAVQGKYLFTPDSRLGGYGVAGWGVYWAKEDLPGVLSEPEWGGFVGAGLHWEASDRVALFLESTYNGFFADPDGIGYFSFNFGVALGIREQ